MSASKAVCAVCPRQCLLAEGETGFCRARVCSSGVVTAQNYGRVTSLALDPIEKKPFRRFHPGGLILSAGSYGCNLRCPFCQNHNIAQCGETAAHWESMTPEELVEQAKALQSHGNLGLAFTYNEPAVGWEWVRDCSRLAAGQGLLSAMVTNGCFSPAVLDELLPSVSAFNIDLKCFTEAGYQTLGGSLPAVRQTISRAAQHAHVEITTLVVPGLSDGEADMEREAAWLASLSPEIPLHLSRYFPHHQMHAPATSPALMHKLAAIAQKHLRHVYLGNL